LPPLTKMLHDQKQADNIFFTKRCYFLRTQF